MAQGQFTKEEAENVILCVHDIVKALTRTKKMECLGAMNDLYLFLEAAKNAAPNEKPKEEAPPVVPN